jgi:hypothetical protein
MPRDFGERAQLALLLFTTLNIAAFTLVFYVVMLSPALLAHSVAWIVAGTVAGALVTAPLAWTMAPRVSAKWRKKLLAKPAGRTASRPA